MIPRDDLFVPVEEMAAVADGVDHPEGICVTPDGSVYVSGEAGQLYRIEEDGSPTTVLSTGGFLLGLAADGEGRVYACDLGHRCVWCIDPRTGACDEFTSGTSEEPMTSPNWGTFASDGSYYVSDSGAWKGRDGKIWVVRPGAAAEVWTRECRDFPNGVALSPDEDWLFVLESTPPALVRLRIGRDGAAGARELLTDLPGTVPDGLAFTEDGSILIACYRPDTILRWRPDDGLTVLAEDPEGTMLAAPTNIVFVGPSRQDILVPNIGRWHVTRLTTPLVGVPLAMPRIPQRRGGDDE